MDGYKEETVSSITDTQMNTQRRNSIYMICTSSMQTRIPGQRTVGEHTSLTPNQKAICNWYLMGEGKAHFSNGVS